MKIDRKRGGHLYEASGGAARTQQPAMPEAPLLLRHRVALPDPIEGFVRRPEVERRCALLDRRLTVLHAPGGFGKTTLLGERCRALRQRGVTVAWLSLDDGDQRGSVAAYLALAFERAGLTTFDPAPQRAVRVGARDTLPDPAADSQAEYRLNLLIRALERHGAPCVLALDELERLRNPDAVAVLNALLRRAPSTLHVGMAYRERPPGLAIAMFALEGRSATVGTEELRFSAADAGRFFDRGLSRRQLKAAIADSAGWPVALRMYRNAGRHGNPSLSGGDDTVAGWIETRLWRGIAADDRDFVLDISLFDEVAPELIDEVTGTGNAARRLASLGVLAGLWSTAAGAGPELRLHPLIKEHCEKRRFEEDPRRYRSIHRGIAVVLARRERVVEALRHAVEAGEPELLGRIADGAGGIRLWLEQGLEALRAVDVLLADQVLTDYPRLALARCFVLIASGDIASAKRVYQAAAEATAGFTRDREGGDDRALRIDHLVVLGQMHLCGCMPVGDGILPVADVQEVAESTDPLLRGVSSLGICVYFNQVTAFDQAIEWAGRARAALGRGSPYLAHVDFHAGSVAMATGHPDEAWTCYDRALKVARASHLRDTGAVMIGEVLAAELDLERSAATPPVAAARPSPRLLGECGAWLDIYAASIGVEVELELIRGGPQAALRLVEDAREYARRTERPGLARWLAALRVLVLLAGGDAEEASRSWRFDRLPEQMGASLDLQTQSWREVEMLSCARLRLFIARREFDAGRELAAALHALATERDLVRTRMRGLALSMVLEYRAGDEQRARAHLLEFLRLIAVADYRWPLARERTVACALLDDVVDGAAADDAAAKAAASLRTAMHEHAEADTDPLHRPLSEREFDVLKRLERRLDKEIAFELNLSYDGVRYRVRSIFAKLGARSRLDAVHRARARGILPPPEDTSEAHPAPPDS